MRISQENIWEYLPRLGVCSTIRARSIPIVIEKEGVPAVLEPYADKYGIALINSQGRFVDRLT
jgi:hypothetical protein